MSSSPVADDGVDEALSEPSLIVGIRLNGRWLTDEELAESRAKGAAWYAAQRRAGVALFDSIEERAPEEAATDG